MVIKKRVSVVSIYLWYNDNDIDSDSDIDSDGNSDSENDNDDKNDNGNRDCSKKLRQVLVLWPEVTFLH